MYNEIDDDGSIKLKTILIGESGVGKTNLINIAKNEKFNANTVTTVNCSFFKTLMVVEDIKFNVYLWDTIGQEKLKSLTKIFFKNSKIVVLVYDITNKNSLKQLDFWLKQVKESLGNNIILGVLGNKKDLFINEEVSEEEGEEYAKSIGARWGLTSAKTDRAATIKIKHEELIEISGQEGEFELMIYPFKDENIEKMGYEKLYLSGNATAPTNITVEIQGNTIHVISDQEIDILIEVEKDGETTEKQTGMVKEYDMTF